MIKATTNVSLIPLVNSFVHDTTNLDLDLKTLSLMKIYWRT